MGEKKLNLISLNECEKRLHGIYKRNTLYKKIWQKILKRYGPAHEVWLDWDEVVKKLKVEGIVE